MATNRADTLDPALLRPGRLDRKIEFPLPSRREKRLIFQTVTNKMNLGPDVDLEDCTFCSMQCIWAYLTLVTDVSRPDKLSSAEITSIVQAAGLQGNYSLAGPCYCSHISTSGAQKSICDIACGLRRSLEGSFCLVPCLVLMQKADGTIFLPCSKPSRGPTRLTSSVRYLPPASLLLLLTRLFPFRRSVVVFMRCVLLLFLILCPHTHV